MIEINNLSFSYGENRVIDGLNFFLNKGEFALIYGANGSGKSTLFKLLLGQLEKTDGEQKILSDENGKPVRLGYVPQLQTAQNIHFPVTVTEFVVYALYGEFGLVKLPKKRHYKKASEVISYLGLAPYARVPLKELSGGLKQRAYIARAMVSEPELYLFDEPTVGIDEKNKERFFELINSLKDSGRTIVMISHDVSDIMAMCQVDFLYELKGGHLHRVDV